MVCVALKEKEQKALSVWVSSNSVVFLKRGTGRRGCSSTCHMSGGVFSVWDLDVACRSCLQFDLAGLFSIKRRKFVCSSCGRKLLFLDVCTSTRRNTQKQKVLVDEGTMKVLATPLRRPGSTTSWFLVQKARNSPPVQKLSTLAAASSQKVVAKAWVGLLSE